MQFKEPKNTDRISWTKHSIEKMKFYGLSPQRVLRVLKNSERREQAVVPGCAACMQTVGAKRKTEIWMMYRDQLKTENQKLKTGGGHKKIITAWRYPGVSPVRDKIPIPEDILNEINEIVTCNL